MLARKIWSIRKVLRREFILLSSVKHELEVLSGRDSPKLRREALFALRLAENCKVVHIEDDENETVDDTILKVAKNWDSPVFTNDRQLKLRLRDISVPVIYVRQKSRLGIDGLIS